MVKITHSPTAGDFVDPGSGFSPYLRRDCHEELLEHRMPAYPYKGQLYSALKADEDPLDKLPLLYADLGVSPPRKPYDPRPILALAKRHVRGFRKQKPNSGKPGRRKNLQSYTDAQAALYGLTIAEIFEEAARANLRTIVNHIRKTERTPGGRRLTQLQIVTRLSKIVPTDDFDNHYYGIKPRTLLSWISHSGPNSEFQKERKRRKKELLADAVNAYRRTRKIKA